MILLLSVIARINIQVIISSVSVFGFYARSISVGKATPFSARGNVFIVDRYNGLIAANRCTINDRYNNRRGTG